MSRFVSWALVACLAMVSPVAAQGVPSDVDGIIRLPPVEEVFAQTPPAEVGPILPAPTPPAGAEEVAPADGIPFAGKLLLPPDAAWGFFTPAYWDPWEGNIELGLSGTEGNTQTFNVRFGMTAKHKTDNFVRTLQITSIQKSANGETTANTALFDGRLEWPMPKSRFNYFMHSLIEYDQFKAFDYRFSGDTGFGYEFIESDATTLIGRAGLSASQEVGGPDDKLRPELLFGGEFKHKFNPTHSISGKIDYYPNVADWSVMRVNSQASWEIVLSSAWGLSLKFSLIDRFDSRPLGKRPNDLDYSTLVLWTF